MRPCELHQRLAGDVEGVCRILLPGGKRVGNEWTCGDVSGKPGDSMKVKLSGDKAGIWADFAADTGGDMIGLYKAVKGCSLRDAMEWAKAYLGIKEDRFDAYPKIQKPQPIDPPKSDKIEPQPLAWLKARELSEDTLKRFKVTTNGPVVNLPYYYGGKVYHCKFKDTLKPAKESWRSSANSTPILFGWQAVPEDCREIVITEGEWDAMSYSEQGIPALSIPAGAGAGEKLKWIELEWEHLERFDTIFLSYDMDKAGQDALPHVISRLGHHRCRVIALPTKDANEAHVKGLPLDSFKAKSKFCDPPELRSMESFSDEVRKEFSGEDECKGDALPWPKAANFYRMRTGELTVWHGYSGHGKSMVISHIFSDLMKQGRRVCVASMELPARKLLKRMYQQIGACENPGEIYFDDITRFITGRGWVVNIKGTAKSEVILNLLDYAFRRYGVSHYLIDSLCKCGFAEDDYNAQKKFIDQLTDFTLEKPIHVHLVAHDRKGENETGVPGKMDVRGTSGITDMADNVISVWRNKPKEDQIQKIKPGDPIPFEVSKQPDAFLHVHKQRYFDWEGKIGLFYNPASHQYLESEGLDPLPMVEGISR